MKINANLLFGAIIGSAITFFFIFLLKPAFLITEQTNQENIKQVNSNKIIEEPFQSEQFDKTEGNKIKE